MFSSPKMLVFSRVVVSPASIFSCRCFSGIHFLTLVPQRHPRCRIPPPEPCPVPFINTFALPIHLSDQTWSFFASIGDPIDLVCDFCVSNYHRAVIPIRRNLATTYWNTIPQEVADDADMLYTMIASKIHTMHHENFSSKLQNTTSSTDRRFFAPQPLEPALGDLYEQTTGRIHGRESVQPEDGTVVR